MFLRKTFLFIIFSLFFFNGWAVDTYIPVIQDKIKRSSKTFTQGIKVYRNSFYESAGLYGKSSVYHYDLIKNKNSGSFSLKAKHRLSDEFFAEDIEIVGNRLYLLSWRKETLFIYSLELKVIDHIQYTGEGWGIAYDGKHFITSDGSSNLTFRDFQNFLPIKSVKVIYEGRNVERINSLEYAQGKLYANVWFDDYIYIINPQTGQVLGIVDCTELVKDNQKNLQLQGNKKLSFTEFRESVLNGIAYDEKNNIFYITGKNWLYLYKVILVKK